MAEFGLLGGLSQDMGYDERINDARYNQIQAERAKAKAASAASLFADEFSQGPIGSEYDDPIISQYVKGRMKEAGSLMKNDPNYKYNPETLSQLKAIKNDIKGNEHVLRATAFVEAKKKLKEDLAEIAKNPQQHDQEAYQDLLNQVNNYNKYGHQFGEEAAQKEGSQAFVYQKPLDFIDKDKLYQDVGSKTQARGINYLKNGRDGGYETFVPEEELRKQAQDIYLSRPRQFDQQYKKKGIDPIQGIMDGIKPYIKTEFKIGEKNTFGEKKALIDYENRLKMAMANPGASPYKITVLDANYAKAPADLLGQTFGTRIPHKLPAGKDGVEIDNTGDVFNYDGDVYDQKYNEKKGYEKNGIKTVTGYVYKPLDFGKEVGYTYDPWGFGEDKVLDDYKDQISIVDSPMDKDGNSHKILKIKTKADVNANDPSYQGRYDKEISTTKQREGFGINESMMNAGTFNGLPIGDIVEKDGIQYLVTDQGLEKQ